jgi:hypothetical protein
MGKFPQKPERSHKNGKVSIKWEISKKRDSSHKNRKVPIKMGKFL